MQKDSIMKVLILSVKVGSGHTLIAKNVEKYFKEHGDEVKVKELFENNGFCDWLVGKVGLKYIFKFPRINNYFYDKAKVSDKHIYYTLVKKVKKEILGIINEMQPDIIISTHIAGRIFVKAYENKFKKPVLNYCISTDYDLPPGIVDYKENEYIIVPNEDFYGELENKGFPKKSILPFGVPIKEEYYQNITKSDACKKLDITLDKGKKTILLMGKRSGLGQTYSIIKYLSKDENLQLICLCGSNEKLKTRIEKLSLTSKAKIFNLTFNNEYIMSLPDIIIGKMGGLSSTEAVTKKVPVICFGNSPKPEYSNLQYFTNKNIAMEISKMKELTSAIKDFDITLAKKNCEKIRKVDSASKIYEHAHNLLDN